MRDNVNRPAHYRSHPSGIECIHIVEHMSFCLGNAIKYLWRADLKGDPLENLRKAVWYVNREIARRESKKRSRRRKIRPMPRRSPSHLKKLKNGGRRLRLSSPA